jgi:hypothetical protein
MSDISIIGKTLIDPNTGELLVNTPSNGWQTVSSNASISNSYDQVLFSEDDVNIKMLLFSRWIAINYGTPEYDVNGYDGKWWVETLKYFNENVYPNMEKNGSVDNTRDYLNEQL